MSPFTYEHLHQPLHPMNKQPTQRHDPSKNRPLHRSQLLIAVIAITLALPACQKCTTCSYTYQTQGQDETYTFPEVCGNKNDRDAQESACKTAAALAGTTCTCSKS